MAAAPELPDLSTRTQLKQHELTFDFLQQLVDAHHPNIICKPDRQGQRLYYWKKGDQELAIVAKEQLQNTLQDLYNSPEFGLCGRDRFHEKLQRHYANVSKSEVMAFLRLQEAHQMTQPAKSKIVVRPVLASAPFQHWQMDITYLQQLEFQQGNQRAKYILVVVDVFSKYCYLRALKTKNALATILAFGDILLESKRAPQIVQTDRGTEFTNNMAQAFFKRHHIQHRPSIAYRPESQGQVERLNFTVKNMIRRFFLKCQTKDWVDILHAVQFNINITKHVTTGKIPATLHMPDQPVPRPKKGVKEPVFPTSSLQTAAQRQYAQQLGYDPAHPDADILAADAQRVASVPPQQGVQIPPAEHTQPLLKQAGYRGVQLNADQQEAQKRMVKRAKRILAKRGDQRSPEQILKMFPIGQRVLVSKEALHQRGLLTTAQLHTVKTLLAPQWSKAVFKVLSCDAVNKRLQIGGNPQFPTIEQKTFYAHELKPFTELPADPQDEKKPHSVRVGDADNCGWQRPVHNAAEPAEQPAPAAGGGS